MTAAGFYAWLRRTESVHAKQDRAFTAAITQVFVRHEERYGSPRVHAALVTAGWRVSRRRVARLMRAAGLRAKTVRGYRPKAKTHQVYARHPNRLWATSVTGPSQVWVGDITFVRVASGWRYLAIVMDQFTRRILAWTLTPRRTARVTSAVLVLAAQRRPARGAIFTVIGGRST